MIAAMSHVQYAPSRLVWGRDADYASEVRDGVAVPLASFAADNIKPAARASDASLVALAYEASDAADGNVSFDRAASAASQVRHGVVVPVASHVTTLRIPANASESVGAVSSHAASDAIRSQGSAICASQLRSYPR